LGREVDIGDFGREVVIGDCGRDEVIGDFSVLERLVEGVCGRVEGGLLECVALARAG
jgi:hypothetical protein